VPDDLKFELQGPDLTWEQWHAMSNDLKFKLQEYQNDESKGEKNKVPYTWWDWHFMVQDMESGRAGRQKFITVGFGPYSSVSKHVPYFIKGESNANCLIFRTVEDGLEPHEHEKFSRWLRF
jgi:hypothetical protein